ncbi:MAG: hypothetical protein SYC29_18080 [Planctomycetota bacterium]|nr:hypothetical protein [Planctomycetota bacterium]
MRRTADVRSIDALKDAKAALAEFREIIVLALSEAQAEVQRTLWWIQHDQMTHWQSEVRRRTERLNEAKAELERVRLTAVDQTASFLEQRKAIERAERRLAEAGEKVRLVRRWAQKIDRESMLFRAQLQSISRAAETDIPRGEAKLEIMLDQLEQYVRLAPPQTGDAKMSGGPGEGDTPSAEDGGKRPGDAESAPP